MVDCCAIRCAAIALVQRTSVVTNAIPTIVFTVALPTVTLNRLTEGAQVQADWMQQITLT